MQIGYRTSYLLLASFLATRGEHLAEVLPTAQRFVFIFEGSPTLKDNVASFFKNGEVGITDFVAAFRATKDLLRQALEDQRNQLRDPGAGTQQAAGV